MEATNETLTILSPLLDPIHGILNALQWIIGGVFGVYLALLIFNWWKNRQLIGEIKGMREDINDMRDEIAGLKKGIDEMKKNSHHQKNVTTEKEVHRKA